MADDDGVKTCNPSRRTSLAVPCEWCLAPAWRESARLTKAERVARKTAPPRQWSVRGTSGKTKARRLSTQGCGSARGAPPEDRRRPDPPDRRTALRGGVGYKHECSRLLPLLRCPPLMMIIIGGESLFGARDEKRHRRSSGPWRWAAAGRGISKGETEGGGSRTGGRGGWDGGAVRRTGGEPVGCASGERGPRRRGGGVCDGRTAGSGTAGGPSAGSVWLLSPAAPAGLPGVAGAPQARGPPGAAGGLLAFENAPPPAAGLCVGRIIKPGAVGAGSLTPRWQIIRLPARGRVRPDGLGRRGTRRPGRTVQRFPSRVRPWRSRCRSQR